VETELSLPPCPAPRIYRALLPIVIVLQLSSTGTAHARGSTWRGETPPGPAGPPIGRVTTGVLLGLGAAALLTREWKGEADLTRAVEDTPLDPTVDVANEYGSGLTLGGAAVGILVLGALREDPATVSLGRDLATALAISWGAVWGLKLAVDSPRPKGGPYSFPSGHTATAFAAAPVFAAHLGTGAGVAAYALASFTGVARIEDEKHYAVDVLAGAALGILAGTISLRMGSRASLIPTPGGAGMTVRF
jgi:membrane-associated phospholipid phosphatase